MFQLAEIAQVASGLKIPSSQEREGSIPSSPTEQSQGYAASDPRRCNLGACKQCPKCDLCPGKGTKRAQWRALIPIALALLGGCVELEFDNQAVDAPPGAEEARQLAWSLLGGEIYGEPPPVIWTDGRCLTAWWMQDVPKYQCHQGFYKIGTVFLIYAEPPSHAPIAHELFHALLERETGFLDPDHNTTDEWQHLQPIRDELEDQGL